MNVTTEGVGEGAKSEDVMKTPEKSKSVLTAASANKFEDSPVFSFLCNLSPIKPIKSRHIYQSITPLHFSLLSMFSSDESTSPQRHEFPSVEESKDGGDEMIADASEELDGENLHPRMPDGDMAADPSIVESAKYSPIRSLNDSMALAPLQRISHGSEANMDSAYHDDRDEEVPQCDWDSLSDTSDLFPFQSPNSIDSRKKSEAAFYASLEKDMIQMQSQCVEQQVESNECYTGPSTNNPVEKMDNEHLPGFYRGPRRRCLVFETNRTLAKHSNEEMDSKAESSALSQSQGSGGSSINEPRLVLMDQGNEPPRSVFPGIGLHLNAIAAKSNDYKIVDQDSSASGRLLIGPNLSVNFRTLERDSAENGVVTTEDAQQAPGYLAKEEANSHSPKKKRRREQAGEVVAYKRCNCKKSKCLKLYCECFAAGIYCVEPCACIDCFNKPIHEDNVLAARKKIESRNPLAFAPKVIRESNPLSEIADDFAGTPASARHKRGCNCKKSSCLKKYCECYQAGVGCSINCRCEGCKNSFGRKDGHGVELELEEEEEEEDEKHMDSEIPPTHHPGRQSIIPQPFSSKENEPPRSSSSMVPSTMCSSASALSSAAYNSYYTTNNNAGCYFQLPPPPKFSKHFNAIGKAADEIPDILLENSSIRVFKSPSPNGKRVSPPHIGGVPRGGLRSSRKLTLEPSIPSFPSLTPNQQ